jgi:diaminopimelate epimerase
VLDRTHIQTEVYERGAGYTLASGTGCCAAAAAAYRLGLTDPKVIVRMPGGTLEVEIEKDGTVFMTGDVGYVGSIRLGSHFAEQLRAYRM